MNHYKSCMVKFPKCPCNTCKADHYTEGKDEETTCCSWWTHRRKCDSKEPCADYIPMEGDAKE